MLGILSHGELVSAARDYHRFAWMLAAGGSAGGQPMISADHLRQMTSDQVPAACKIADSFFAGFRDGMGWGLGVAMHAEGPRRGPLRLVRRAGYGPFRRPGRHGRRPATQVELGEELWALFEWFQPVHERS